MSRTDDALIDRRNAEGPLSMSEADLLEAELLALEQQHDTMLAAAKRVRYHLTECGHGDAKTLKALDDLLKYIGIHDQVVPRPITQPSGEMAVHHEE